MNLSIAIQAGGESRRMGRDKALIPFLGEPLVQRVCRRLDGLGTDLFITTNQPGLLAFLERPCFPDVVVDRGALGGLCTALTHARNPLVAVVACDMPFASPDLLRFAWKSFGSADVAIFRNGDGFEPLHALYRREPCLAAIQEALAQDRWRVDSWFPKVQVRVLEPASYQLMDPKGLAFMNVNTPEDLLRAEELAMEGEPDRPRQ
jgi:molybdopterin-guanine dinucleotide biosynthesis protein A